jgi:hypothetical protein
MAFHALKGIGAPDNSEASFLIQERLHISTHIGNMPHLIWTDGSRWNLPICRVNSLCHIVLRRRQDLTTVIRTARISIDSR